MQDNHSHPIAAKSAAPTALSSHVRRPRIYLRLEDLFPSLSLEARRRRLLAVGIGILAVTVTVGLFLWQRADTLAPPPVGDGGAAGGIPTQTQETDETPYGSDLPTEEGDPADTSAPNEPPEETVEETATGEATDEVTTPADGETTNEEAVTGEEEVTTAPAATIAPSPTTTWSSSVEPMPMSALSFTAAPWMVTLCPTDTLSPISMVDFWYNVCSTLPSCMFTPLPMRMLLTSPRSTAPNQMLQSRPITTSPMMAALSAR